MIDFKKCKGQGKAIGFDACGQVVPVETRKFGLCRTCLKSWYFSTKNGREMLDKTISGATKKAQAKKTTAKRKDKIRVKRELMSARQYHSKVLQPVVNEIARIIDYGNPCIATGTFGKENGGHYYSVGSNITISLNLHNIHIQSFHSNHWKSGDDKKYRVGLERNYGRDYLEFVETLPSCPPLKLSKQEVVQITDIAKDVRRELRSVKRLRTPMERIILRNEVNATLGIYSEKYNFIPN